ncbi:receptor-like protein 43 [Camellia sinensis]|uniref:receptor-like protein 43 n=1 Tax=Camellia sinensis TaxID=4442 RepID=UPI001035DB51|nr:receptor-like protein 43 [Camellia sinensis]
MVTTIAPTPPHVVAVPVNHDDINLSEVVSEANLVRNPKEWWVDTSATRHFCVDKKMFTSYSVMDNGKQLFMGNSSTSKVEGSIPASCGNLTRITKLWFNNFSSQIPSSISNLAKLTHLDLSKNNLYEQIPDSLGNMSQLTNLDLSKNNLNGQIPDSLDLRNNKLHGQIPGPVYELQNLTYLLLSSNNLCGVVELDKLLKLKNLTYLNLSYNGLSLSINNSVNSTLTNFDTIGLASCNLSEFPNFLREQTGLFSLDFQTIKFMVLVLRFNRFHGHIGTFKTKGKHLFPKLRIIDISYNEFTRLLTTYYIKQFEAMMNVDEHEMKLKYTGETYYQYSMVVVVVMMKGLEIEYSRILTVFSIIDLSSNKFQGEILKSIEKLNSL